MAKKTIKVDLSKEGLARLQRELQAYKTQVNDKLQVFVTKLANYGVKVAESNVGNFGKYILFQVRAEPSKDGCKAILLATDKSKIISKWKTADGIKTAEVSPLLMAEFGSGQLAQNPNDIEGVGQGTFPGQTHAFDSEGWYWVDMNDELHHSYGINPTMPMFKAAQEMENLVMTVAKEVFG